MTIDPINDKEVPMTPEEKAKALYSENFTGVDPEILKQANQQAEEYNNSKK